MKVKDEIRCVVCKRPVRVRTLEDIAMAFRPARHVDDCSFSLAMDGWVCFGCQCERLQDPPDEEDTLPTLDPNWPEAPK